MNALIRKGGFLQTHLSVSPLPLCVDRAVALGVLTGWFGLWWVPLEGTAKLETLVLRWHGDAEARETLGAQVGLHACCYTIRAFETSPSVTQRVTRGSETFTVQQAKVFLTCILLHTPFAAGQQQLFMQLGWLHLLLNDTQALKCHAGSTQCLPCLELVPHLFFILCHLRRCDSCTLFFSLSLSLSSHCQPWWSQVVGDIANRCNITGDSERACWSLWNCDSLYAWA